MNKRYKELIHNIMITLREFHRDVFGGRVEVIQEREAEGEFPAEE